MDIHYQLMVDLDAIIDTRIGVVDQLDPELSCKLIEGGYRDRTVDSFMRQSAKFSESQYLKAYSERNIKTLERSTETPMLDYVAELILSQYKEQVTAVAGQTYRIFLNTDPYILSEPDKQELATLIAVKIPMVHDVKVVSIPKQWLTPNYFKTNGITAYITYSAFEWLKLFHADLQASPMQSFHLVGPELTEQEVDESKLSEEELEAYKNAGPFRAFELSALPFIAVRLIPAEVFTTIYAA